MNTEELYKQYTQLLRGAQGVLTPSKIVRWTPFGKNTVYELINSGKLRSFQYRGSHIVAKADLIDYLVATANDQSGKRFRVGGGSMVSDFSYLRDNYPQQVTSDQVRQMLHIKPDRSYAKSPASEIFRRF